MAAICNRVAMADDPTLSPEDIKLARALVHDAEVKLNGSSSADHGHDQELQGVHRVVSLADKILAGKASDEDRALVPELVHPSVRSLYL
jgi:hypothetical protein